MRFLFRLPISASYISSGFHLFLFCVPASGFSNPSPYNRFIKKVSTMALLSFDSSSLNMKIKEDLGLAKMLAQSGKCAASTTASLPFDANSLKRSMLADLEQRQILAQMSLTRKSFVKTPPLPSEATALSFHSLKRKMQQELEHSQSLARVQSSRNTWEHMRKIATNQRKMVLWNSICSGNTENEEARKRARVKFNDKVTVILIPSCDDYCLESRKNMWGTSAEKKRSIRRNKLEFAFEGFDLANVLEEKDFVCDDQSGNIVHPVYRAKRRRSNNASI